jgi:hypothetical protein
LPSDALVAGAKDMTGGPLTEHRLVSYYGHPLSGAMGVLGQYEPQEMVERLLGPKHTSVVVLHRAWVFAAV